MINECIVCNSLIIKPHFTGLSKCEKCGHIFADMELNVDQLTDIYRKNYFFGDEYSNYIDDKAVLQKNFRRRLNVLQKFIDPTRHKRLLEIGSAYGFFLDIVKNQFDLVQGIDITEDGVRYARQNLKLNALLGDYIKQDFNGQHFDIVCMWDTIEHLPEPQLYIEKVGRETASGALLAITTGDIESLNARIKKERWRLIHPPTHIHYFSLRTLTKLLDNYGFDVVYKRHCGFFRSIDNIAYNVLVLRNKQQRLYNILRRSRLTYLNFYLNLYDIMFIIARKR